MLSVCRFGLLLAWVICVLAAVLLGLADVRGEKAADKVVPPGANPKTEWMFKAKVGMSTHYIGNRGNVKEFASRFQVEKVAEQAAQAGAGWFLFTLHHQTWALMAPNSAYDRIVSSSDFTAERDIPSALAKALTPKRIKLMLYVNLRLDPRSVCPAEVRAAMGGWPPNDTLIANMAAVYREFSMRYGNRVAGWWVDGAWMKEYKNSPHRERWFATIAQALRAGNADAIVAFNPGIIENVAMSRYSKQNDYTAGEANTLQFVPKDRWIDGVQCHIWTYLGKWWSASGLRFDDEEITNYARQVTAGGGVLTFEAGTLAKAGRQEAPGSDPNSVLGEIDPRQVKQVKSIVEAIRKTDNEEPPSPPNKSSEGEGKYTSKTSPTSRSKLTELFKNALKIATFSRLEAYNRHTTPYLPIL